MFIVIYKNTYNSRRLRIMDDDHYTVEMSEYASGYGRYVNEAITYEKTMMKDSSFILHIFDFGSSDDMDSGVDHYTAVLKEPIWTYFTNTNISIQKVYECIDRVIDRQQQVDSPQEENVFIEF